MFFIGWLVVKWVDSLVGWLIGLVDWLIDWCFLLLGCLSSELIGWLVDWLIVWCFLFVGCQVGWLVGWLGWLVGLVG